VSKQRKSKSKPATLRTDAEFLAEQMAAVATMMWTVAESMEYFAGFNPRLVKHGRQLAGASAMLKEWAGFVIEQARKGGGK
jgi:hypothetical protein